MMASACQIVGGSASVVAVVAAADSAIQGGSPSASLVVALGALITASASVAVPMFKAWLESRTADRAARYARHDLANKLQEAELRIHLQDATIEEDRRKAAIVEERMAHQDGHIALLTTQLEELRRGQKEVAKQAITNKQSIADVATNVAQIASQSGEFPAAKPPEGEMPENQHSQT
jgi:hypothetical protein